MTQAEMIEEMHVATVAKLNAETAKLIAESVKFREEGEKLREEQRKMEREWRWYPVYAAVAFIGAVAGLATIIAKFHG